MKAKQKEKEQEKVSDNAMLENMKTAKEEKTEQKFTFTVCFVEVIVIGDAKLNDTLILFLIKPAQKIKERGSISKNI